MRRRSHAAVALGIVGVVASAPAVATASPTTPYRDPAAVGSIGLCDRSGHQLTHGSVTATPFAWRAVSSVGAPNGYGVDGRTATLLAYQPRKGVVAGEWSGDALTAATRYTNTSHPTAVATKDDESLSSFIAAYHPQWDGLLQLRLYLGAPNTPIYSTTYPTLDIKVTGKTWRAVGARKVSCNSGKAVSLESIVLTPHLPKQDGTTTAHSQAKTAVSAETSATPRSPGTPVADATSSDTSGHGTGYLISAAAVVVLLGAGYGARRRLTRTTEPPGSASSPTTKGR